MGTDSDTNPDHAHPSKRNKIIQQIQSPSASTPIPDSKPAAEEEFPNIPNEIIIEILTWLPVKSLVRFRCVSKSWLSIVSSPQFIKTHLAKSSNNDDYTHHRIIFHYQCKLDLKHYALRSASCDPFLDVKHIALHSALYAPFTEAPEVVDYPKRYKNNRSFQIVGSCNGLICMAEINGKGILLWNPSIKRYKKLPDFGSRWIITWGPKNYMSYGFGYDESNDDYKVVGISTIVNYDGEKETHVKVYSRKTHSWRKIDGFEVGYPTDEWGYFASGKLHWRVGSDSLQKKIVSLDLANKKYQEVEPPECVDFSLCNCALEVVGGCLSLLCYKESHELDLWILKEYGKRESWTRVALVPYSNNPGLDGFNTYSRPVFLLKDGNILFKLGTYLACYNPKDNSLMDCHTGRFNLVRRVHVFVESLVVPNANEGKQTDRARKYKKRR